MGTGSLSAARGLPARAVGAQGFERRGATGREPAEAVRRERPLAGSEPSERAERMAAQGLMSAQRPQESEASGREGARRRPVGAEGLVT